MAGNRSLAASGQGEMAATLVDPKAMSEVEAKEFCANQQHLSKCIELQEKWDEDQRQAEAYSIELGYTEVVFE